MEKHIVIIVPGIPSFTLFFKILTAWFRLLGLTPIVFEMHWRDKSQSFTQQMSSLLTLIDKSSKQGDVSLIGISAGGSAVLNGFYHRRNNVQKVVTICSRLAKEKGMLSTNMKKYTSFKESIELLEANKSNFSLQDKRKILRIRGIYDERMSPSVMVLDGTHQSTLFMLFHAPIIFFALSFFSNSLINFLKTPIE